MRKILTVATGILLLAASCSKEADNETKLPAPDENQIRATIEPVFSDATTRSEFDSNMKIIWSLGDQIGVMTPEKPDANMTYVIREQEHCSAGIFTLDADIKLESDTFYAYYPRTANDCCMTDEAELSLVLPAVQTYKKNSFATNANIAVAVSTDGREYAFRNACSYLDVKLQGDGIVLDKIVITAGKDTSLPNQKLYLAGSGKVCFNDYDSEPVFELDGSSDNNRSITLNCDNVALEADAPTDFYFVMPAGTYSGIAVDVYTADGQKISYVKGLLGEGLVFERNYGQFVQGRNHNDGTDRRGGRGGQCLYGQHSPAMELAGGTGRYRQHLRRQDHRPRPKPRLHRYRIHIHGDGGRLHDRHLAPPPSVPRHHRR